VSRWLPEWLRRSPPLVVAVDAQGFAWTTDGELRTGTHQDLGATFASIRSGSAVDIVVCSDVAVHWLQQVPRSVASFAELRQAAAARCAQLFGGKPSEWRVTGDWRVDREFVGAGIPRALMNRIEGLLEPLALRIRWHTAPSLVLNRRGGTSRDGWSGVRCAATVALWHATAGHVDSISVLRIGAEQDEEDVLAGARRHVVLERARRGFVDHEEIGWLDAPRGGGEAEVTLGFCRPQRRFAGSLRLSGVAAVIAGIAALVAIGLQVRDGAAALTVAQDEMSRLQVAPAPAPAPQRVAAAAQQRRVLDQITRQLNTPWSQLLDALESSLPDDVALVSIEPDGSAGKVRLQSEARSLDTLVGYAASLRNVPMFTGVALLKHETNDQDPNRPLRLMMELELGANRTEGPGTR
jgi:Tfp pilus assembly protein PilN